MTLRNTTFFSKKYGARAHQAESIADYVDNPLRLIDDISDEIRKFAEKHKGTYHAVPVDEHEERFYVAISVNGSAVREVTVSRKGIYIVDQTRLLQQHIFTKVPNIVSYFKPMPQSQEKSE